MVESFNLPNDGYEEPNKSPEDVQGAAEGTDVPKTEASPEFNEKNIDIHRLRSAIEIALGADDGPASMRFKKDKELQDARDALLTDNYEELSEAQLREEIRRAESENNESDVLRLEGLLMQREKERRELESTPEGAKQRGTENAEAELRELQEENEDLKKEVDALREKISSEGWEESIEDDDLSAAFSAKEETDSFEESEVGVASGQNGNDNWSKLSYGERLTAMSKERDPLGLAGVALRETLSELGKKEEDYKAAGPFGVLDPTDKLRVVREYEEYRRKHPWSAPEVETTQLKGLIYGKIEEAEKRHSKVTKEGAASGSTEEVGIKEEISGNAVEEEMPIQTERSTSEEKNSSEMVDNNTLIDESLQELRESVKATGNDEGSEGLKFFDIQRKNLRNGNEEEVETARAFIEGFLKAYIKDARDSMDSKSLENHNRVLEILSNKDELTRLKKAA